MPTQCNETVSICVARVKLFELSLSYPWYEKFTFCILFNSQHMPTQCNKTVSICVATVKLFELSLSYPRYEKFASSTCCPSPNFGVSIWQFSCTHDVLPVYRQKCECQKCEFFRICDIRIFVSSIFSFVTFAFLSVQHFLFFLNKHIVDYQWWYSEWILMA